MKNKRNIIILLQFVLVIASVAGMILYMDKQQETTEVFTYARAIDDPGYILTDSDIRTVSIPKIATNSGFATSKEDIVGKYAKTAVGSGQYVYSSQLGSEGERDVFETLDLSEYRMISLPINLVTGLSGNIKKGDTVDLLYMARGQKQTDNIYATAEFQYSKTFLQNVLVYSVNTPDGFAFEGYNDVKETDMLDEKGDPKKANELAIITLAVPLSQAEEIHARLEVGKIAFVGRFDDSKDAETMGYAIGDYGPIFAGEGEVETDDIGEFRGEIPETPAEVPFIPADTDVSVND